MLIPLSSLVHHPLTFAGAPETVPYPPRITLVRDLFMATHMTRVRKAPELPMSAPTTVRRGWSRMKPSAHSAYQKVNMIRVCVSVYNIGKLVRKG